MKFTSITAWQKQRKLILVASICKSVDGADLRRLRKDGSIFAPKASYANAIRELWDLDATDVPSVLQSLSLVEVQSMPQNAAASVSASENVWTVFEESNHHLSSSLSLPDAPKPLQQLDFMSVPDLAASVSFSMAENAENFSWDVKLPSLSMPQTVGSVGLSVVEEDDFSWDAITIASMSTPEVASIAHEPIEDLENVFSMPLVGSMDLSLANKQPTDFIFTWDDKEVSSLSLSVPVGGVELSMMVEGNDNSWDIAAPASLSLPELLTTETEDVISLSMPENNVDTPSIQTTGDDDDIWDIQTVPTMSSPAPSNTQMPVEFDWTETDSSLSMSWEQQMDSFTYAKPTTESSNESTYNPTYEPTSEQSIAPTYAPTAETTYEPTAGDVLTVADDIYEKEQSPAPSLSKYTLSPSKSPTETLAAEPAMKAAALVQFEMRTMSSVMNKYEVAGVFEPSCIEFLATELSDDEPAVLKLDCKITDQQILSRRMLSNSGIRRLQSSSSLLVDVSVTGETASPVNLDILVRDAFAKNSQQLISTLRRKGAEAGSNTFNDLNRISSIHEINEKLAITGEDSATGEEEMSGPLIALVTLLTAGCVLVALLGLFTYKRYSTNRMNERSGVNAIEAVNIIEDELELSAQRKSVDEGELGQIECELLPQNEPKSPATTYNQITNPYMANAAKASEVRPGGLDVILEEGLKLIATVELVTPKSSSESGAGPQREPEPVESNTSPNVLSVVGSFFENALSQDSFWLGRSTSDAGARVPRDIVAPPGVLGIVLDTHDKCAIVHSVKEESPLHGKIFKGDLIKAVDGKDTTGMSSTKVSKLMAAKRKYQRTITVVGLN